MQRFRVTQFLATLCAVLTAAWGLTPAPVSAIGPGNLRVSFVDVGQGDGAVAVTPAGQAIVIDAGPPDASAAMRAELRALGARKVDWVVASHPHADHIGGLPDLMSEYPPRQVLDPTYVHGTALQQRFLKQVGSSGARLVRARAGSSIQLDPSVKLQVLAPPSRLFQGGDSDANNNSIVCRLSFGATHFLFTGDLEADGRAALLKNSPAGQLRADVLKVAHHGSHNGTDPALLAAVRPRIAVISCGRGNDYGHPHREALDQLARSGSRVLRTDQLGTIRCVSNGKTVRVVSKLPVLPPKEPSRPARVGGGFIGNPRSHVVHAADCKQAPRPGNRVEFKDLRKALSAGYRSHAACLGR